MKPEDRLDDHVDRSEEVVAAADMAQLVSEHRLQLRRRQTFHDAVGQQEDRAQQARPRRVPAGPERSESPTAAGISKARWRARRPGCGARSRNRISAIAANPHAQTPRSAKGVQSMAPCAAGANCNGVGKWLGDLLHGEGDLRRARSCCAIFLRSRRPLQAAAEAHQQRRTGRRT